MLPAAMGDTVTVHYTGKLENGEIFDASPEDRPLQFIIGENEVIPGFEQGVVGMVTGEKRTLTVSADQAYGPKIKEQIEEIEKSQLPEEVDLKVGGRLEITGQDGHPLYVQVTALTETTVTLDANHPLAGKDLIFDVHLLQVKKTTDMFQKIMAGALRGRKGSTPDPLGRKRPKNN
ncbi:MAG: peptidylprolyl isomerase [Desulfuromonadaceae bacterium]|jgi:peptidylprolyl isomerase